MPELAKINLKEKVRRLPHKPGVYLMKDRLKKTIYVGKAKDLKKRVATYFQTSRKLMIAQPKVKAMIDLIHDFDIILVKSEAEALLLEGQLIKKYKPRYNTDFVDDKHFLMVRVNLRETLPRFRLTRNRVDSNSRYYGPFAHAGHLRKTLAELRRKFGILLSDAKPTKVGNDSWQLYDDARQDIYNQPNIVTKKAYYKRMNAACKFLEGQTKEWLSDLEVQMKNASEARNYERAASVRDLIEALKRTAQRTRKFERNQTGLSDHGEAVDRLQEKLDLTSRPSSMECFDISHISGSFCVASMVSFKHGKPDRKSYRRYKIKSFIGNDDFRAMEEVVSRRYRRLSLEKTAFPDLIVVDGGTGQVTAALKAFFRQNLEPPTIIGLAKRNETIIFSDGRDPINLPHHDPGLRLLQYIRDEAHHFANRYNSELRSQRLRESILEDFKGLGPTKREALMKNFGSFRKLRNATLKSLCEVDGIGPKTAINLIKFLRSK